MSLFGIVGGSYSSQSPNADSEATFNLYPEAIEGQGKSAVVLYTAPGLKLFTDLGGLAVRNQITFNGRAFGVSGTNFIEYFSNGTQINRGSIAADLNVVSMVAGPNQVLIASAGLVYVFDLTTNAVTPIAASNFNNLAVSQVEFMDGFYIALIANSNTYQTSALLDATTWPGLNIGKVSEYSDNVTAIKVIHERVMFLGLKQTIPYYDAGLSPGAPIAVDESAAVIEQGTGSPNSQVVLDNTLFFVGQDARGAGIAWRMNGYTPQRVSGHAQEWAWSQYPSKVTDVIGWSYQDQGHSFWVLYFPSGNATWVYDVATGLWSQRGLWNGSTYTAFPAQNHVFCFGKHLVGDNSSGKIYEMNINFMDYNGQTKRVMRRSAHISNEQQWIFHESMQVDIEVGVGPIPPLLDGNGIARDPQINLRWSDDGGHTWSNYYAKGIGQAGKYAQRVIYRRLGRSRDRIYELSATDPVPYRIIEAYLEATPGFAAQERIAAQLRKVS